MNRSSHWRKFRFFKLSTNQNLKRACFVYLLYNLRLAKKRSKFEVGCQIRWTDLKNKTNYNKLPEVPADIWRKFHVCHQWEKGTWDPAGPGYTWEWWDWVLYALCGPTQYKKTVQRGVECTCTVWGLEWNSRSKKSNFRWWYLLTSDPIIQQLFLRFDRGQWQPETIHRN